MIDGWKPALHQPRPGVLAMRDILLKKARCFIGCVFATIIQAGSCALTMAIAILKVKNPPKRVFWGVLILVLRLSHRFRLCAWQHQDDDGAEQCHGSKRIKRSFAGA